MHGKVLVPLNASRGTIMVTARSLANPYALYEYQGGGHPSGNRGDPTICLQL